MWRRKIKKKKKGLMLIYCGLLVVYGQIYGLMVRVLGGGWDVVMVVAVFFLSSRFGFLGWFNGLCSFSGRGGWWWFLLIWGWQVMVCIFMCFVILNT